MEIALYINNNPIAILNCILYFDKNLLKSEPNKAQQEVEIKAIKDNKIENNIKAILDL